MQQTADTPKVKPDDKDRPVFHYTLDGEPMETQEHVLTPRQILAEAQLDPNQYYLVQIKGNAKESYQGKPDEPIHMHEKMEFVSVFIGATPVS